MPNLNTDQLFQLIKTLTKAEKRYFKLFVSRNNSNEDKKFIKLFDWMDKKSTYDESKILSKHPDIKASQISNLKAHLYKNILLALRSYNPNDDIDLKIGELYDFSKLLYNRCLYDQCMKQIEKARNLAMEYNRVGYLYIINEFEKKLIRKYIRENIEEQVNIIDQRSISVIESLQRINDFTNLTLKLYARYLRIGFARNSIDFEDVNKLLYSSLPVFEEDELADNEKILLYNIFTGYYFFIQDFNRAYEYALRWMGIFERDKNLIFSNTEVYIRALNNLLVAQSKLYKYKEYRKTLYKLRSIPKLSGIKITLNIDLLLFKYGATHRINKYFLVGEFNEGAVVIPKISAKLEEYQDRLDLHSVHVFYYKFACMYFGKGDYKQTIFWLNKIINSKDTELRSDIQCFARIVNLICHYELENTDQIEYFMRSTYRYLTKKDDLHLFQQYSLAFLRKMTNIAPNAMNAAFKELMNQLLPLEQNPYEKRAFTYFDMTSWLESKLKNKSVQEIIQEKSAKKRHGLE